MGCSRSQRGYELSLLGISSCFFYFIGKSVLRGYGGCCIAKIDKNFVIQADYVKIFLFFCAEGKEKVWFPRKEAPCSYSGRALFLFWKRLVLILEAPWVWTEVAVEG